MNIAVVILVLLAGFAGSYYHWIEVQKRGEPGSFLDYFFRNNTDGTKAAVVAFAAAMQALYISGAFNGIDVSAAIDATKSGQVYSPLFLALAAAFGAGYACDSKLNSGVGNVGEQSPNALAPEPESQPGAVEHQPV